MEIEKLVVLLLECRNVGLELLNDRTNVLKVVLLESSELLDSSKKFDELRDSSAEEVELTEDLVRRELELFALWHVHESLLGDFILLLISLVKFKARLEDGNELLGWVVVVVPEDVIVDDLLALGSSAVSDPPEVEDVVLAVVDHLLGNLHEETGHAVVGVVVSGDGVDHLDAVHEGGKGILDRVRGAFVEGLDELLEGREVLDVVLGLVKGLGHAQLD